MSEALKSRFSAISETELNTITEAYAYITVLIAGADGKIDSSELDWGNKIAHIRSYNDDYGLKDLFENVEAKFEGQIESIMSAVPGDVKNRYEWISPKLEALNDILIKLSNEDAYAVYKSLTSFAKHIAKAEGGFFGMGSISSEESKLMRLPMINEVEQDEEEE